MRSGGGTPWSVARAPDPDMPLALAALLDLDHPIKERAQRLAEASFPSGLDRTDTVDFSRDRWRACAEAGIQALTVPTELGGAGAPLVEAMLTFEGLGKGTDDTGFVFALSSQVFAMQRAFVASATPGQLERWLPGLLSGDLVGAFAMTEIGAGSDSSAITTTATRLDDGDDPAEARYRLDGEKTWITLAPVADVAIVFATTDPALGRWGITAFLVDLSIDGVVRSEAIDKMGLRSSPFGTLGFEGCEVSAADRLGPEGAGGGIFNVAVEGERAFLFAGQLGATERLIERTIDRARTRRQFGTVIGAHQAVAHRIADMKLDHETARLLVYKSAALADEGRPISMTTAMAKLHTSEMAVRTAVDAIGLHGAEGFTTELGIEKSLRDAVGGLAYSGTSDIQRMIIARLLRVDAPRASFTAEPT